LEPKKKRVPQKSGKRFRDLGKILVPIGPRNKDSDEGMENPLSICGKPEEQMSYIAD